MTSIFKNTSIVLTLAALGFLLGSRAQATLGEKEESVETVRKALGAQRHASTNTTNYTVHEVATDGYTLREYAGKDGVVFAVTWHGLSHPDLSAILGNYFEEFKGAQQQAPHGRGRVARSEVHGANIVVIRSGRMRSLHGKAYIVSLLPEGVNINDIH